MGGKMEIKADLTPEVELKVHKTGALEGGRWWLWWWDQWTMQNFTFVSPSQQEMGDSDGYRGHMTSTQLCYWLVRYKAVFFLMTCGKFDLHCYYYYHFFLSLLLLLLFLFRPLCAVTFLQRDIHAGMFIRDRTVVKLYFLILAENDASSLSVWL